MSLATVQTRAKLGIEASAVCVEVHISNTDPLLAENSNCKEQPRSRYQAKSHHSDNKTPPQGGGQSARKHCSDDYRRHCASGTQSPQ